jgi:aspartate-semialdehyde dehydrogenase
MIDVAVVGATGIVGNSVVEYLESREFPLGNLYPLNREDSTESRVTFKGKQLKLEVAESFDFSKVQLAFFCVPGDVAKQLIPLATAKGCTVIDHSGSYSLEKNVPLVIPECGIEDNELANQRIISSPVATVVAAGIVLKVIQDIADITQINLFSLQAISEDGRAAVEELATQTARILNVQPVETKVFAAQIAFNVHSQLGPAEENGGSKIENQIGLELLKLLGNEQIMINVTTVRVPVFFGTGVAINISTRQDCDIKAITNYLKKIPNVDVVDVSESQTGSTAVTDLATNDALIVSRLRHENGIKTNLSLWVGLDNSRKGSALNGVQIGEILVKHHL